MFADVGEPLDCRAVDELSDFEGVNVRAHEGGRGSCGSWGIPPGRRRGNVLTLIALVGWFGIGAFGNSWSGEGDYVAWLYHHAPFCFIGEDDDTRVVVAVVVVSDVDDEAGVARGWPSGGGDGADWVVVLCPPNESASKRLTATWGEGVVLVGDDVAIGPVAELVHRVVVWFRVGCALLFGGPIGVGFVVVVAWRGRFPGFVLGRAGWFLRKEGPVSSELRVFREIVGMGLPPVLVSDVWHSGW